MKAAILAWMARWAAPQSSRRRRWLRQGKSLLRACLGRPNGLPLVSPPLEDIWWFLFSCAEDPDQGFTATYLRTPLWQEQVPDGLTPAGRQQLLAWVHRRYRGTSRWLRPPDPIEAALADDEHSPPVLVRSSAAPRGVNVLGHFCHVSGLRVAALAAVEALHRVGVRTSCRDVPGDARTDLTQRSSYLGRQVFDTTLLHVAAEPLMDTCYVHSGLAPRPGVRRIAVWYGELEQAPAEWARRQPAGECASVLQI